MGKRYATVVCFLALLGLALPAAAQPTVNVGSIPIGSELPLHAAIRQGFFDEEGINLKVQVVAGGAAAIPALVGGSLQLSMSAYISVFAARDKGFDITIVAPYDRVGPNNDPSPIIVRADSGISRAQDLAGKTVAVNVIKSLNWLYAVEWISRAGLNPERVNWLELAFPPMLGAVRAKQVDAAYATEPFTTLELAQGGLKVLARPFSEVDSQLPISGVIGKETWLKANSSVVERFARALRKGTDYLNRNKEKWPEVLATYTRIKPEWVPKMTVSVYEYPVNLPRLQASADLTQKWGLTGKRLDVKEAVWPTALAR